MKMELDFFNEIFNICLCLLFKTVFHLILIYLQALIALL